MTDNNFNNYQPNNISVLLYTQGRIVTQSGPVAPSVWKPFYTCERRLIVKAVSEAAQARSLDYEREQVGFGQTDGVTEIKR
jgi:hypothetical protein